MIYITGDTHTPQDIHKLCTALFPAQKTLAKNDYVIICGDFGGVWNGGKEEMYSLNWLNKKNFATLFVDGNHENHHMLNEYPVVDFCGGKAHRIMDSVYHLMRGQVFTISGMKFFTMGGAASHDKPFRCEGESWWPEEMPGDAEYEEAIHNLAAHGWQVDYVITHCAADSIQDKICEYYKHDALTNFLEVVVKARLQYRHWYFGHYHIDDKVDEHHSCVYNEIIQLHEGEQHDHAGV